MQCCVLALLTKLHFSNTYAEGSELRTGEENGYKITEFRDTSSITSRLHIVWFGVKEWTFKATNRMKAFHVLLYALQKQ